MTKNTSAMVKVGMLAGLAAVLMIFLEIPVIFFPSFLRVDLSELPALLGGFALGPVAALFIELIKNVLHFILKNDGTGGIGNLANFIVGVGLTVPAAFIYKRYKSFKGALAGMVIGLVTMLVFASAANYWLLIPAYAKLIPLEAIISMAAEANPSITDVKTYVVYAVIPFNALKALLVCGLTMLTYKRLSPLLHK